MGEVEAGESLNQIGRALERKSAAVRKLLCEHGGIEPERRTRRATHLSPQQRESISRSVAQNLSMRAMAREFGKAPSTVSREIKRNGGRKANHVLEKREATHRGDQ
jgi:AraC-like DNA-binding protein